jgi:alkylation response protein AidB-like acyl-CoA dehydrogenase
MNFRFTEEQEELRESARSFLADHSAPEHVRRAMESELGYDPEVWKRIGAELGWPAVIVPEAYGGLGLGAVELTALLEVMGESLFCAPFFASVCLGARALLLAGSEAHKQEHLPRLAEGHTTATLAWMESDAGLDAAAIETVVTRDGDDLVLTGRKRFVLDGHSADLVVVAARAAGSSGEDGVSLVLVPGSSPGLERRALATLDQTRRLAELDLHGVRVPLSARLGDEGAGWAALQRTLDLGAIALAAEQLGGAQRCLDLSVERVQFGRPIGSFQAIQHKCADMMLAVECARSAAYAAACVAGETEESNELARAASLAKATASDAFFRCAADAIQIHGGVGFTWEYDVHLYFKRAQWGESYLGDPAWHRERVARLIGL